MIGLVQYVVVKLRLLAHFDLILQAVKLHLLEHLQLLLLFEYYVVDGRVEAFFILIDLRVLRNRIDVRTSVILGRVDFRLVGQPAVLLLLGQERLLMSLH